MDRLRLPTIVPPEPTPIGNADIFIENGKVVAQDGNGGRLPFGSVEPPSGVPYKIGAVTGDVTVDWENGTFQQVTLTGATAARTLNAIGNPAEGRRLLLRLVSDAVAAVDRTLALTHLIHLPQEYSGPNPITLPQGTVRTLLLYCNGTAWELQSIGGAYAV